MRKNKLITLLLTLLLSFSLVACKNEEKVSVATLEDVAIIHDEKFGGFYIDISIEDFNELGFTYGDSINLKLSSGTSFKDIPYYNGYYTKTNEILLCAYPGYEHVKVQCNNGPDLYETYALSTDTKATVTLNEKGKYIDIQEAMDTVYKNERDAFSSDEIFANFRVMKAGTLKDNILYRSASPVDNEYNRAAYVDSLIEKAGVNFIINLSDNQEDLQAYMAKDDFNSPYAKSLYENQKMILLDMGNSYQSDAFKEKVVEGLTAMVNNDGPYLIHCVEGKDRTGFVAILLEALCNASYDQMLEDYMETYDNYYQINKTNKQNQYLAIVDVKFNDMVFYLADVSSSEEMAKVNMQNKAIEYLLTGGMDIDTIDQLIAKISN